MNGSANAPSVTIMANAGMTLERFKEVEEQPLKNLSHQEFLALCAMLFDASELIVVMTPDRCPQTLEQMPVRVFAQAYLMLAEHLKAQPRMNRCLFATGSLKDSNGIEHGCLAWNIDGARSCLQLFFGTQAQCDMRFAFWEQAHGSFGLSGGVRLPKVMATNRHFKTRKPRHR